MTSLQVAGPRDLGLPQGTLVVANDVSAGDVTQVGGALPSPTRVSTGNSVAGLRSLRLVNTYDASPSARKRNALLFLALVLCRPGSHVAYACACACACVVPCKPAFSVHCEEDVYSKNAIISFRIRAIWNLLGGRVRRASYPKFARNIGPNVVSLCFILLQLCHS